ncbi:Ubiquinol oxidase subunit 2 precursor [Cognatishimia activa]|uniref:Ubiquinol oxidase polypeptide II n=2 Tax=Cognatishimia activa TaxID=1715691 RepID=A0A0P1IUN7_9RHOB|nr:Ubiquinol oxidase subunit 2 precursor [Cognatishimia activa]CUK27339.1 Ubiquinol oxidase subunit 2 precursor [Cognatishimia activa]
MSQCSILHPMSTPVIATPARQSAPPRGAVQLNSDNKDWFPMRFSRLALLLSLTFLFAGCNLTVLNPSGDIAQQQGDLIVYATVLMLIVIIPVTALTIFFAVKYRQSNENATYEPEWDHSVSLEIVVWAVPLAIIICLAGLTWVATHRLEPYDDLKRISAEKPIDPTVEPLEVQVVALDWKWLFIYPEQGIAVVNEAAAIVDRPVEWKITSNTVMNAFYIPEMAGMIYAMAGMETELNAVINAPGTFKGISANYSGIGFSHMNFDFHAVDEAGFDVWVEKVKTSADVLDRSNFDRLQEQTTKHPVEYFGAVEDGIWDKILNMCAGEEELCLNDMMMVDALGGGGLEGLYNRELFRGLCSADDPEALFLLLRKDLEQSKGEVIHAMSLIPPSEVTEQKLEAH